MKKIKWFDDEFYNGSYNTVEITTIKTFTDKIKKKTIQRGGERERVWEWIRPWSSRKKTKKQRENNNFFCVFFALSLSSHCLCYKMFFCVLCCYYYYYDYFYWRCVFICIHKLETDLSLTTSFRFIFSMNVFFVAFLSGFVFVVVQYFFPLTVHSVLYLATNANNYFEWVLLQFGHCVVWMHGILNANLHINFDSVLRIYKQNYFWAGMNKKKRNIQNEAEILKYERPKHSFHTTKYIAIKLASALIYIWIKIVAVTWCYYYYIKKKRNILSLIAWRN